MKNRAYHFAAAEIIILMVSYISTRILRMRAAQNPPQLI